MILFPLHFSKSSEVREGGNDRVHESSTAHSSAVSCSLRFELQYLCQMDTDTYEDAGTRLLLREVK